MANPKVALLILAVRDVATMKSFYQAVHFALNVGVFPAATAGLTRTEIYLHCDDLGGAIERAAAAGARPLSPRGPRSWGDEAAYFADPEGNVVVLARPLSAE